MAYRFPLALLLTTTLLPGAGALRPDMLQQEPEAEVVRPGPGVTLPKLTHKVEPHYSQLALDAGVQGNVLLELIIDDHGVPHDLAVRSPLGFGLDERALECVSQWRFKPAMKNGQPVRMRATVETSFRLLDRYFDAKAEERRTQFNAVATRLSRHSGGKPSDKDVKTIQELADHKFAAADYLVGLWELRGEVLPKNESDGLARIQRADKSYGPALFFLGNAQVEGILPPKDPVKGLSLLQQAAVLGSIEAQFTLGKKYASGEGMTADVDRAKRYFRLCAAFGQPECQFRLGQLLLTSPQRSESNWLQAIAWLELAEGHGFTAAQSALKPERAKLTPEQTTWVARLKNQLEHKP